MKKITLLLSFIACVVFAQAQLLLNENFNYAVNTDLLNKGNWLVTGTNTASPNIQVTPSTITYSGYVNSGVGQEVILTNGQDLNCDFTAQTSGTVYVSFLVNVTAAPAAGDYFLHVGPTDMAGNAYIGRTFVKTDAGKIAFGILQASGGTATYTTSTYDLNTTYLVILKHDVTGKTSSIIVNPSMTTESTTDWISNNTGTNATANIGSVGLRQPSASANMNLKLDGIRVATSYSALFSTSTGIFSPKAEALSISLAGKTLTVKDVAAGSIVDVYSSIGAKVHSAQLVNGSVQLDNLSKGLYIVRVGNQSSKIML